MPVLGEWGWFDTSAHTAGGKTRVGIVVGIAGDQILVAVGTSTDRGPPRHTVLEGGRLGRRLGLRNPTHFYPYGFLKLPASSMTSSCGRGPPEEYLAIQALFPHVPEREWTVLAGDFSLLLRRTMLTAPPAAPTAPPEAPRDPDPEKP